MIAWIFWHTRHADAGESDYRTALRAFHDLILTTAPEGFLGVRVLRHEALPWLVSATEVYEDWYFVESSAALDALDEAALAAFSQDAHARIARLAATATAGLYRLRAGEPLPSPAHTFWMSKPRQDPYAPFIERLSRAGTVWSRKMVLGPAPEFCVERENDDEGLHSLAELHCYMDMARCLPARWTGRSTRGAFRKS